MAVLLCVNMLWMALEIQRHDLFDGVAKFLLVNVALAHARVFRVHEAGLMGHKYMQVHPFENRT